MSRMLTRACPSRSTPVTSSNTSLNQWCVLSFPPLYAVLKLVASFSMLSFGLILKMSLFSNAEEMSRKNRFLTIVTIQMVSSLGRLSRNLRALAGTWNCPPLLRPRYFWTALDPHLPYWNTMTGSLPLWTADGGAVTCQAGLYGSSVQLCFHRAYDVVRSHSSSIARMRGQNKLEMPSQWLGRCWSSHTLARRLMSPAAASIAGQSSPAFFFWAESAAAAACCALLTFSVSTFFEIASFFFPAAVFVVASFARASAVHM